MTDQELEMKIRQILANVKEWDKPRKLLNLCKRYANKPRKVDFYKKTKQFTPTKTD